MDLDDESGVNKTGISNVGNITELHFEEAEDDDADDDADGDADDDANGDADGDTDDDADDDDNKDGDGDTKMEDDVNELSRRPSKSSTDEIVTDEV